MRRSYFILSMALSLSLEVFAQQQEPMKQVVEYLASEKLSGRFPATAGDTLASEYLVSKLRDLGMKPIRKEKQSRYYQDFTFSKTEKRSSHNIVAVLPGHDAKLKHEYIVVGAHYDHLGMGGQASGSRRPDTVAVHPGADDNASSNAVLLELARHFKKKGSARSLIFVFFGAEEQGIVGSKSFVEWMKQSDDKRINLTTDIKQIGAMLNLHMVGRMRDNSLSVSGTGTSSSFKAMAERVAEETQLHVTCTADGYGPSDQAAFVAANIPVLYLTTGGHMEYHTPDDKPATLNYDGMQQTLDYAKGLLTEISNLPVAPDFIHVPGSDKMSHAKLKVTLGLMPDVTGSSNTPGLRADIVMPGKPAHAAGIRSGDVIQEIDGKSIKDIEEYMERLSELEPETTVKVKVLREGEIKEFDVYLKATKK